MGLEIRGVPRMQRRREALKYVKEFGLFGFEDTYPRMLSGGMKQRVAIARTLIANPEVLLMDEPFGFLDSQTRMEMQNFLLEVWERRQTTVVFVTHNVNEAIYLGDRVMVMSSRPSRIMDIFDVDIPRPRERSDPKFSRLREEVFDLCAKL